MTNKITASVLSAILIINTVCVIQAENLGQSGTDVGFTEKTEYIQTGIDSYTNNEALVLYKDGSIEVKTYNNKSQLEEGISDLINDETVDVVQPNYTYENTEMCIRDRCIWCCLILSLHLYGLILCMARFLCLPQEL